MASKYLQKYPVPAGFQEILADLTRQILRDQPPNIIQYAAKYFEMLEKGQKFQFNSKFNVSKDDKKYQLAYNAKNAEQITKKASNIAAKVNDSGKQKHAPQQQEARREPVAASQKKVGQKKQQPKSISSSLPPQLVNEISRIFDQIDENHNGFIESREVRVAVETLNQQIGSQQPVKQSQIKQFIEVCDANHNGRISRTEFINFIGELFAPLFVGGFASFNNAPAQPQFGTQKTVNQQEVESYMNEQGQHALEQQLKAKFNAIFNQVDTDRSGYITTNQIQNLANKFSAETGGQISQAQLKQFMQAVDTNSDGRISRDQLYDFFIAVISGQGEGEEFDGEEEN